MKVTELTEEQAKLVDRVIWRVWNAIAGDIDFRISKKGAIELCLDANRPSMFAGEEGKQVEAILDQVDDFNKVLTFFAKRNDLT